MDWFYLFAVQGTLKSLVQHHSLKASILWYSAFFYNNSHPILISDKTIALTIQSFAGKAISPLFSMLSAFSWLYFQGASDFFSFFPQLWSLSTVNLEPRKIKSVTVFIVFPGICHEVVELDAMILVFWSVHTTSRSSQTKSNAKRQNGCLRRLYK